MYIYIYNIYIYIYIYIYMEASTPGTEATWRRTATQCNVLCYTVL